MINDDCVNCTRSEYCDGNMNMPCRDMQTSKTVIILVAVASLMIWLMYPVCKAAKWLIFGNAANYRKETNAAYQIFSFALFVVICAAALLAVIMLLINGAMK